MTRAVNQKVKARKRMARGASLRSAEQCVGFPVTTLNTAHPRGSTGGASRTGGGGVSAGLSSLTFASHAPLVSVWRAVVRTRRPPVARV